MLDRKMLDLDPMKCLLVFFLIRDIGLCCEAIRECPPGMQGRDDLSRRTHTTKARIRQKAVVNDGRTAVRHPFANPHKQALAMRVVVAALQRHGGADGFNRGQHTNSRVFRCIPYVDACRQSVHSYAHLDIIGCVRV